MAHNGALVLSAGANDGIDDHMEENIESGSSSSRSHVRASKVWKYFEAIDPRTYMCRICKETNPQYDKFLKRNSSSSTTNFWKHLEVFHAAIYNKLRGKSSRGKKRSTVDSTPISSSKKRFFTGTSLEKTVDMLGKYIYKVDKPWLVVEDPDFRRFVHYCAQTDLKIPSRKTIQAHATTVFETEKAKLKVMLAGVRQVSLMVDACTTKNMIRLIGITMHWIDEQWALRERILSLTRLEDDLTGEHLSKVVSNTVKDFSLETKVIEPIDIIYKMQAH